VVGADTYTPLAGAALLVLPGDADVVAAADALAEAESAATPKRTRASRKSSKS
jgi:hypothetical protein